MKRIATVLILAALAAPAATTAQQPRPQPAPRPAPAPAPTPAWLGLTYDLRWTELNGQCASQVVVESVVQGSPAERAGLRGGDLVIAMDGHVSPAVRLHALAGSLAPGDSVRLRVSRAGTTRDIIAVADRRPDRPPPDAARVPSAQTARGPVIRIVGDTLVATGLPGVPGAAPAGMGFWLAEADGRASYRVLGAQPRTELGRRVAGLLTCASGSQVQPALATVAPAALAVQEIQARADSLRVLMASRALESGGERRVVFRAAPEPVPGQVIAMTPVIPEGARAPLVGFEGTFAAALVGVAGAEVTALEPELAAYFRPARSGLLVLRVAPGTASDRAGLRPGDVILAAAGETVESPRELRAALATGTGPVELAVVRQGRRRTVTIPRP